MSEAAAVINEDDAVLDTDFAKEMVRQMRAVDSYGTYDEWPSARILAPFVLTKDMKRDEVKKQLAAILDHETNGLRGRCGLS